MHRITYFNDIRDSVDLFLDAGDLFSYRKDPVTNEIIINLLDELNYDVMTSGELDLHILDSLNYKPVSLNIKNLKDRKILQYKNIKICITGAIDPSFNIVDKNNYIDEKIEIRIISDKIKEMKESSDILIFLSHLKTENERKLFIENESIDVMISGHSGVRTYEKINNRVYVSPGRNAEYIGKISIMYDRSGNGDLSIKDYINRFISMNIDSVNIDTNAKSISDSIKNKNRIENGVNEYDGFE